MAKRALGEFEHQVLLCVLRNGSESYSTEIVLELEARTGKQVATAAVFVALEVLAESRHQYLSLWDGVEVLLDEA